MWISISSFHSLKYLSWMVIELNRSYWHKHEITHHRMSNRLALIFRRNIYIYIYIYIFIKGCVFFHMFRNEWNSRFSHDQNFSISYMSQQKRTLSILQLIMNMIFVFLRTFSITILLDDILNRNSDEFCFMKMCVLIRPHICFLTIFKNQKLLISHVTLSFLILVVKSFSSDFLCNVIFGFFIAFSVLRVSSVNSCVWLSQYLSRFFLSYESHVLFNFTLLRSSRSRLMVLR